MATQLGEKLTAFIEPGVSSLFTTINQQGAINPFLKYLYYSEILNIPKRFSPQGTIIRESNGLNTAENQISHFFILLTWCSRVKWLKCRHFCVEFCIYVLDLDIRYLGSSLHTRT